MEKKNGYRILLIGKKKRMQNKKFDSQVKNVPIFKDPRRRKAMWEEHVSGNTLDGGVIAEFGVHKAQSIGWFTTHFLDTPIYGFDSFEGLPEDWIVKNKVFFPKGHFNLKGNEPKFPHIDRCTFIKGWFKDTLPGWVKEVDDYLKILHIDCDIYSSTLTVLTNVKSMFRPGTFILFDEILDDQGKENEYKAFFEFCELNPSFDFDVIARTTGQQVMIKVLSV